MSFYRPEQRCPRCRFPYTQGELACPNCGLALAAPNDAPRGTRSGPQPSWQAPEAERPRPSSPADRFGSQGGSGPQGYRPSGQVAPGGSGPWGNGAGSPSGPRAPQYQQQPGGYAGAGERFIDADHAPTNYQRPGTRQGRPSAGWDNAGDGQQRPSAGYRNSAPGWDSPAGAQRPFADYDQSGFGRGTPPSNTQRPSAPGRDVYAAYQDWAVGAPEDRPDASSEAGSPYNRSQTFRGTPGQSYQPGARMYQPGGQTYQPGGQTWQQQYPGAPTGYAGGQQGYDDFYDQDQEPAPRRGKKTALIALAIIVILAAVGGGAAYLFIGSKPTLTVTSTYMVGTTPAASAGTALAVSGARFAPHSAVSFLIDGQPEPGQQIFQSDGNGALTGNLAITSAWPLGQHTLTAKDASGNTPLQSRTIAIVAQGAAGTPGPKGAPADDASFMIDMTIHSQDLNTGEKSSGDYKLAVTGRPDPAGGTVCSPGIDTGQPQSAAGTDDEGVKYVETYTITCSGTYKGGKLTYIQTFNDFKIAYANHVTCSTTAPVINQELDGAFTDATSISGTQTSGSFTISCTNGNTGTFQGVKGTWVGTIAS